MMRYVIVILGILSFSNMPLWSQELSKTIIFDERVYNFGTILEEKGKVSHTFLFRNTGKTPVVINEVTSGCGCIGKAHSKGPVPPGGKGEVSITFDPEYKSGFFSKEILIFSDNNKSYNHVWVEGIITPAEHPVAVDYPYYFGEGLHLRLKVMAFGYLKPGETRKMELHYANATDKAMVLKLFADGNREGLAFTTPVRIAPKGRGVMDVFYTMPYFTDKDVTVQLHPYVNNKKLAETLEIKILNGNKKGL